MDRPAPDRWPEQTGERPFTVIRPDGRPVRPAPVFRRREPASFADLYHRMLALPLWGILAAMAVVYVAANLLFGALYLLTPGGVGNLKSGDYWDAFFFSVQTFGTIGYGYMFPRSLAADVIVTAESFTSLVYMAVATGLVFARVSRPTARVMFSSTAIIGMQDGKRTLMLRAANRRSNQILEAEVMINLARQTVTKEGQEIRRFEELKPLKPRTPLFAYTWMIMHVIEEDSPLHGLTAEDLDASDAEILVVLSGVDDRFSQRVHARYSYLAEDIAFDRRFIDVLSVTPDGRWVLDYTRFHDTAES